MTSQVMTRASLKTKVDAGAQPDYLFFWGHKKKGDSLGNECFSQWYPHPFITNEVRFLSAEHYMMTEKALLFDDSEHYEAILDAASPGAAKALGRKVRGFSQEVWAERRTEIVVRGNLAKFSAEATLRDTLLRTGERVLVEAAPRDCIWGIGLGAANPKALNPNTWRGLNLLGFALMEVRDQLRALAESA